MEKTAANALAAAIRLITAMGGVLTMYGAAILLHPSVCLAKPESLA